MIASTQENIGNEPLPFDGENECSKAKEKENEKKKKPKEVGMLQLFRFTSPQDRVMIIIGLILATVHATAMPTLMFVFGIAVRLFADQYHTSNYFDCLHEEQRVNCSAILYCSDIGNQTDYCCLYDQFKCVGNDKLLENLDLITWYCVIITIVVFFSGWAHATIFHFIGDRQILEIRKILFRSIILQDMGWFDVVETSEITSRVTEKLDQLEIGLGESFSITFQTTVSVLILTLLSFYYEWRTALVFLGNWPIAITAGIFLQQMEKQQGIRKDDDDDNDAKKSVDYGEAGAIAEEVLSAIHTVTSYGGQSVVVNRYSEALEMFRKSQQRKLLIYGLLYGGVTFGVFVYAGVTYWFGSVVVQELNAGFTNVVMAILCADAGFLGLAGNAIDMDNIGIAQKAAGVIFDYIDRVPTIDVSSNEGVVPTDSNTSYGIAFHNVTFSYPSRQDTPVLEDLNLTIQNGQTVALVGGSGSGKSTIVQLLQRFYDVDAGELLVGGYNIRELNLYWLRQHIGVVSQEPVLFATTIAENIRYGKEDITQDEIEAAAKAANAHQFILDLPDGYDTLVGERGTQLSGGQKQRVAIARALVRDPKILLLDEATSALDTESEAIVQAALDKASEGRTTIVIAHRLSTIKQADVIAVVEDGRIVEVGTQNELLAKQGRFFKLVIAQLYVEESNNDEIILKTKSVNDEFSVSKLTRQMIGTSDLQEYAEEGREMLDIIKTSRWPYLLIAIIASFAEGSTFCLVSFSFLVSGVQSFLNPNTAERDARPLFVWFAFISVVMSTAIFSKGYFFGSNGGVLISQLRRLSLQAMLRQEIGWFDMKYNWTGALVSKLAIDASLIQNVVGNQLGIMISSAGLYVCATILTFIYLDPSAAAIIIVTLLPLALSPVILRSTMSLGIARNVQTSREESNHVMFEAILHIRTVASLNLQDKLVEEYTYFLTSCQRDEKRFSIILGLMYGLTEIVQFVMFAIMLRFGAYLVTLPSHHRFHTNFINVFVPLLTTMYASGFSKQLGHSLSNYLRAKTAIKTIFTVLHRMPQIDVYSTRGLTPDSFRGEVSFDDVIFAYPTREEVPILNKLSFSVMSGETVAIVGASGCGKSTVTSLLERFYDPLDGVVRLDNTDIKLFNIQWLRRQIGLVSQEPILFDTSIADNIRYGANFRDVTDEEVEKAAKNANIHDFIISLPQGYNTKVGPKGGHLSGGQKQRVAIARALVRDPKILLLDEATSALDTESEKIVDKALEVAQGGRTCIKIAHRISTVCNADKIIVINDGRVVETGTHTELMQLNGLYCHMNNISL